MKVGANSEYGRLREVIIQPPGIEQERVLPWDGVHPYLDVLPISREQAEREYQTLRDFIAADIGIENIYTVEQLLAETLANLEWPQQVRILTEMSHPSRRDLVAARLGELAADRGRLQYSSESLRNSHTEHLSGFLAREVIQGYPWPPEFAGDELSELTFTPKRTLMWTRDCAAMTPVGAIIGSMAKSRRNEESAILSTIFKHHPRFGEDTIAVDLPRLQEQDGVRYILEGGNVQLYGHIVAIGMGDPENDYACRTNPAAAEKVTRELFAKDTEGKIEQIMHVYIPDFPINIHLDSIFNMVGPKAAVAMPYVFGYPDKPEKYYRPLKRRLEQDMVATGDDPSKLPRDTNYQKWGTAKVYTRESLAAADDFGSAGIDVKFIDHLESEGLLDRDGIAWVGGVSSISPDSNVFHAINEQADLAANVFCIGPFRMITYDRNKRTIENLNKIRRKSPNLLPHHNYYPNAPNMGKIALMPSRELRATWGGPHCMTLPLSREPV
jgi:arginine deiminase